MRRQDHHSERCDLCAQWERYVRGGGTPVEQARRFDMVAAHHQKYMLTEQEIVGDTLAFLNAHGDNQRMMDSMDLRWTPPKPLEAGTP